MIGSTRNKSSSAGLELGLRLRLAKILYDTLLASANKTLLRNKLLYMLFIDMYLIWVTQIAFIFYGGMICIFFLINIIVQCNSYL